MISVSPAILDGFADIIPLASGMKSVSETVFSILQMIIDATARTLSVADRLLSVSGIIVCAAARILSVAEIIISNRWQIPSNQRYGGSPFTDNYFRHGNDLICVGKDYLKNGNNPFHRRLNFLQLAHNPLRNERIYFLHRRIHFHRGHVHSREGERFFHGGHDNFRLGHESLRDRNRFPRRGENPRRCADGCVFNTNSSTTNR